MLLLLSMLEALFFNVSQFQKLVFLYFHIVTLNIENLWNQFHLQSQNVWSLILVKYDCHIVKIMPINFWWQKQQ